MNIQSPRPIPSPLLLSEWISATLSLKKHRRGVRVGVETKTMMSAGEGPCSRRPRAPEIEENQNAKRCCNWIRAHAGEMAAKRETMMSAAEGPSGGVVNPMPGMRVLIGSSRIPTRGQAVARRIVLARGQRSGRGACLMFESTSVWQRRRGVEGASKVWRTSSQTLATTTTTERQVSLNLTAFLLVL
jgi:hypothetical protein